MENEKKNSPAGEQKSNNAGNRRSKHRSNKHKSYFMTPGGEQTPASEQKQPKVNQQQKKPNEANANAGANSTSQKNPRHNNHHKHKKNNSNNNNNNNNNNSSGNQPKDEQKNASSTTVNAPQSKPSAPKPRPESSAQEGSQKNNNHNRSKNKRRRNNDKRREDRQTAIDTPPSTTAKAQDVFTGGDFVPMPKSDRLQKPSPQKLSKFSDSPEYAKYSDYDEFSFEELYGKEEDTASSNTSKKQADADGTTAGEPDEPMVEVVGIRFKASGKTYYFDPNGVTLKLGAKAIVETARGLEYGDVALGNTMVKESETVPPLRSVIRKATDADVKHHEENKAKEDEAFRICNEKIIAHGLEMKLIDAQYTFDNTKLLFYFTSAGRVDFRDLVKDLASVFRTRIELRQIGIRDEAKMVGGLGLCGRPLCCSLFLTDFGQVSIKMAKEQNLSLNSSKISGICGRLMCCLRYEHDTYEYEIKRTPPVDSLVRTVDGVGVVTEINPLAATIKVKLVSSPDTPPKSYKRDEVSVLKKKQDKQ